MPTAASGDTQRLSDMAVNALNDGCFCVSLDQGALRQALQAELGESSLLNLIEQRCPYVFAASPVFITGRHARQMQEIIGAVEAVVRLPAYRAEVLRQAAPIARQAAGGAQGVFFGYDFHLHDQGAALIEINTNAGGAMLNAVLARAQRACCEPVEHSLPVLDAQNFEEQVVAMFRREWQASGRATALQTIAIVDEAPEQQYLYPEFLLFQHLFRAHGIEAVIAGPAELTLRDGALWHAAVRIDLAYNRLTDFMLASPACAALHEAYLAHRIVLTPHPQAHALYANKRNLALLTDAQWLADAGVAASTREILLAGIPRTEVVQAADADRLWAERRKLFFKPVAGYGSRAAYRGDKLTRRVWDEILEGEYVAQALVAPAQRAMGPEPASARYKFDLRAYAYEGQVQWLAARLYQGQTTNFRTPGGGFAPVYVLP